MNDEFNLEAIISQRKESAAHSLRVISVDEARGLIHEIFADNMLDPWFEMATKFLAMHPNETILRGELPEHAAFLFFPNANKGLWYREHEGIKAMGPIADRGLAMLSEIAMEKNLIPKGN